jgi:hypothetical protein
MLLIIFRKLLLPSKKLRGNKQFATIDQPSEFQAVFFVPICILMIVIHHNQKKIFRQATIDTSAASTRRYLIS